MTKRVDPKRLVLTSIGTLMLLVSTLLGLGWSELKSLVGCMFFGESRQPLREPRHAPRQTVPSDGMATEIQNVEPARAAENDFPKTFDGEYASEEERVLVEKSLKHSMKAWDYSSKKKYWKAIREANKAIKIDPGNYDAYDCREAAYQSLGVHRKKRLLTVQGIEFDLRYGVPLPAGLTRKERSEILSSAYR